MGFGSGAVSHREGLFGVSLLQITARAAAWVPAEARHASLAAGEPLLAAARGEPRRSSGWGTSHQISTDQTGETGLARCGQTGVGRELADRCGSYAADLALFNRKASLAVNR